MIINCATIHTYFGVLRGNTRTSGVMIAELMVLWRLRDRDVVSRPNPGCLDAEQ